MFKGSTPPIFPWPTAGQKRILRSLNGKMLDSSSEMVRPKRATSVLYSVRRRYHGRITHHTAKAPCTMAGEHLSVDMCRCVNTSYLQQFYCRTTHLILSLRVYACRGSYARHALSCIIFCCENVLPFEYVLPDTGVFRRGFETAYACLRFVRSLLTLGDYDVGSATYSLEQNSHRFVRVIPAACSSVGATNRF